MVLCVKFSETSTRRPGISRRSWGKDDSDCYTEARCQLYQPLPVACQAKSSGPDPYPPSANSFIQLTLWVEDRRTTDRWIEKGPRGRKEA